MNSRDELIEAAAKAIRADIIKTFWPGGNSFEAASPTTWEDYREGAAAALDAVLPLIADAIEREGDGHWSRRWNPWLMVARGYAVLLPGQRLAPRGHFRAARLVRELGGVS